MSVQTVFAGHIHICYPRRFPDRHKGIFFINTVNAGQTNHSDGRQTITEVLIDGQKVSFLVVQAPDGKPEFSAREQW